MRKKIIIDGKETRYSVTDDARIFNDKTGRELKGTYKTNEYHSIQLIIDGKPRTFMFHRLVAEAFCENPNGYTIVDHIDRDKHNDNASNLRWVDASTNAKNVDYSQRKGKKVEYYEGDFTECRWEPTYGISGYMVSEYGQFVKLDTNRILALIDRHGYKRVSLNQTLYSSHIIVWESFNKQKVPANMEIDHIDGVKDNNCLSNLALVSHEENMRNAYKNGHATAVNVYQFTLTGEFVAKYNTFREAAKAVNGNEIAIKDASNRFGTSAGYYWLREKDKDKINKVLYGWVPEGFKIIPSLLTYCINKEGKVYNKRNKKLSPIKGTTVKYIEVKGKHRQIEDLLKETFNI